MIEDPDTEEKMIVEIFDPDSPEIEFTSRNKTFQQVREWLIKNFHPTKYFKKARKVFMLTGVGFFDFLYGQRGMAPNGRDIHPVLSIKLSNKRLITV